MAETTPVEEMPLGMLIAWLSVFLAVVLFGVALPVIDVRWVVPFVVFAAVLFTGAFAGPFLLVRWLRSRAGVHRSARHARKRMYLIIHPPNKMNMRVCG